MGALFMWILKKKYDYWWTKYGLEKTDTDRATKTSLFDRNWAISLKPRRRSRPLCMVWWALNMATHSWYRFLNYHWIDSTHVHFEYELHAHTPKSSNRNTWYTGSSVLIGRSCNLYDCRTIKILIGCMVNSELISS